MWSCIHVVIQQRAASQLGDFEITKLRNQKLTGVMLSEAAAAAESKHLGPSEH